MPLSLSTSLKHAIKDASTQVYPPNWNAIRVNLICQGFAETVIDQGKEDILKFFKQSQDEFSNRCLNDGPRPIARPQSPPSSPPHIQTLYDTNSGSGLSDGSASAPDEEKECPVNISFSYLDEKGFVGWAGALCEYGENDESSISQTIIDRHNLPVKDGKTLLTWCAPDRRKTHQTTFEVVRHLPADILFGRRRLEEERTLNDNKRAYLNRKAKRAYQDEQKDVIPEPKPKRPMVARNRRNPTPPSERIPSGDLTDGSSKEAILKTAAAMNLYAAAAANQYLSGRNFDQPPFLPIHPQPLPHKYASSSTHHRVSNVQNDDGASEDEDMQDLDEDPPTLRPLGPDPGRPPDPDNLFEKAPETEKT